MALTVEQAMSGGPAARSYLWDVEVNVGGGKFNARCTTASQPNPSYEKIENNIRGFTVPEVGAVSWNDIAFTLIEDNAFTFIKAMYELGKKAWNPESGTHDIPEASGTGDINSSKIILNSMDGSPVVTWTLHGAVLTGEMGFPGTTSEKAGTYEITFNVAYAYATQG